MKIYAYHRVIGSSVLATTVALATPLGSAHAQIGDADDILRRSEHVVYVETNDIANAVLAFRRDDEGRLTLLPGTVLDSGQGRYRPFFQARPLRHRPERLGRS